MDATSDWRSAFPLQTVRAASEALLEAWYDLALPPRNWFNEKTREPALTKKLKPYVQRHVVRERGLFGMWAGRKRHR